jgi:hypothetical protein
VACVASEKPPRLFTRYTSFSRQILLHEMFNRIHATLDDSKDHKLGRRPLCCAFDTDPFGTSQQSRDAQFGLSATADDMGMTVNRLKRSQSPWRLHSSGQESEHHARLPWSTRTSILSLVPILSIRHCDNENPLMIWARDSIPEDSSKLLTEFSLYTRRCTGHRSACDALISQREGNTTRIHW